MIVHLKETKTLRSEAPVFTVHRIALCVVSHYSVDVALGPSRRSPSEETLITPIFCGPDHFSPSFVDATQATYAHLQRPITRKWCPSHICGPSVRKYRTVKPRNFRLTVAPRAI